MPRQTTGAEALQSAVFPLVRANVPHYRRGTHRRRWPTGKPGVAGTMFQAGARWRDYGDDAQR
jgi:hypothetical protein